MVERINNKKTGQCSVVQPPISCSFARHLVRKVEQIKIIKGIFRDPPIMGHLMVQCPIIRGSGKSH